MMAVGPLFIFIIILLIGMGFLFWMKGEKSRKKKGKGGAWLLITLGIFLALLFVRYFFAYRSSPERVYEATYVSQPSGLPRWYEKLSQEYVADVYPSLESAARALGHKIAPKVASIAAKQQSGFAVYITQTNLTASETASLERKSVDGLRHEITNILQLPSLTVKVVPEHEKEAFRFAPESLVLQVKMLSWSRRTAPWSRMNRYQMEGTLQVSGHYENEEFKELAQFSEKPWVEDFARFRAQEAKSGTQTWIFAQSETPGHKASFAQQEAIEDGMRQLRPLVESRLHKYLRRGSWFGSSRPNTTEVREILRQELRSRVYDTDRFEQRFQQHGTTVWWEGILINASDRNLDLLADRCAGQRGGRQQWTWARTAWSVGGLFILVCGVYLFVHLATRGYYAWALRGVIIVVLIFILVMVRML